MKILQLVGCILLLRMENVNTCILHHKLSRATTQLLIISLLCFCASHLTMRIPKRPDPASEYVSHCRKRTTSHLAISIMLPRAAAGSSQRSARPWVRSSSSFPLLLRLPPMAPAKTAHPPGALSAQCFLLSAYCYGHWERTLYCSFMGTNFLCRHIVVVTPLK